MNEESLIKYIYLQLRKNLSTTQILMLLVWFLFLFGISIYFSYYWILFLIGLLGVWGFTALVIAIVSLVIVQGYLMFKRD